MIMRNYDKWNQLFVNIVKLADFENSGSSYEFPETLKSLDTFKVLTIAYTLQPITDESEYNYLNSNFGFLANIIQQRIAVEVEEAD